MNDKQKVKSLLEAIETGNQEAFAVVNPNKYIQHNLAIPDGMEGIASVTSSVPVMSTLRSC